MVENYRLLIVIIISNNIFVETHLKLEKFGRMHSSENRTLDHHVEFFVSFLVGGHVMKVFCVVFFSLKLIKCSLNS